MKIILPKPRLIFLFAGLTLFAAGNCSCSKTLSGGGILSPAPAEISGSLTLSGEGLILLNGEKLQKGRKTHAIRAGENTLTARSGFGPGVDHVVSLGFTARKGQVYTLKRSRFPQAQNDTRKNYVGSKLASDVWSLGEGDSSGIIPLALMAPVFAIGSAEVAIRSVNDLTSFDIADFENLIVVSNDPAEGVVAHGRCFKDGTVKVFE